LAAFIGGGRSFLSLPDDPFSRIVPETPDVDHAAHAEGDAISFLAQGIHLHRASYWRVDFSLSVAERYAEIVADTAESMQRCSPTCGPRAIGSP